jgi:hypothetical protein
MTYFLSLAQMILKSKIQASKFQMTCEKISNILNNKKEQDEIIHEKQSIDEYNSDINFKSIYDEFLVFYTDLQRENKEFTYSFYKSLVQKLVDLRKDVEFLSKSTRICFLACLMHSDLVKDMIKEKRIEYAKIESLYGKVSPKSLSKTIQQIKQFEN